METEKSRIKIDRYGRLILSDNDILELILNGKDINFLNVNDSKEIELFKKYQSEVLDKTYIFLDHLDEESDVEEFHKKCSNEWFFPLSYQQIDIRKWLLNKCKTKEEIERVNEELEIFEEKDLMIILNLCLYIVDYMRENNFIWGIGRGSSVSSYCLYLIGIHRVDSIRYGLSIHEYLR